MTRTNLHMPSVAPFSGRFFSTSDLAAKAASAVYVLAIPLSHALRPSGTWVLALVFLWLMLLPYPLAACRLGAHQRLEMNVALSLACLGLAGLVFTPWLLIVAIALHGLWDMAKRRGVGVRFFSWYILGCAIVDLAYAAVLALFLLRGAA